MLETQTQKVTGASELLLDKIIAKAIELQWQRHSLQQGYMEQMGESWIAAHESRIEICEQELVALKQNMLDKIDA